MRVLLVSHPPLLPELGAAQVTMNLAAALAAAGTEVVTFSPEPLPPSSRWFRFLAQRRAIERYIAAHGPFDVLDMPSLSVSATIAASGFVVARSIQPDLDYLRLDLTAELRRRPFPSPRLPLDALIAAWLARAIRRGFARAHLVLCMGSLERSAMGRRFPRLEGKLEHYLCAPADAERPALAEVRRRRARTPPGAGIRFLWLGRWAAHKGTDRLLSFLARRAHDWPRDRCTIAGCGPGAGRAVPAGLLASGQVRLVERFTRRDLPALLAEHDAGLFTSHAEGWGLSLQEMLESGMPVFATRAGAVADLEPYFPRSLQPFPPGERLPEGSLEDLEANGYLAALRWQKIAADYRRIVEERLGR